MLPLGKILLKYGILFDCCVDDTQLILSLKSKDANSTKPLLDGLEEIKTWVVLRFLSFNESKTEFLLFGPIGTYYIHHVYLCFLKQFVKFTVKNLGVKIDSYLKLDEQINPVIKSIFFSV